MSRTRSAKIAAASAALLLVVAPACTKKNTNTPAVVVEDSSQQPDSGGGGGGVIADPAQPKNERPTGTPVHVQASVTGLGDVLQLVKQATTAWNPKNPLDASAWVQAMLLQFGYGPGLWNSLDLTGVFAVDATLYAQNGALGRLLGSVAATNPKGVMEAMPSGQRPQPLGNGLWELVRGETRVLLRETPKTLEFALSKEDLAKAPALAADVRGRRVQVRGSELPPGLLGDFVPGVLPRGLRRQVAGVLNEATSAAVGVDAGTDRDLVVEVSAAAPFERLGLGPLGPARSQPTALEGRLPGGPALVVAIPLGSPELLHKAVDGGAKAAESMGIAGGPFEAPMRDTIKASHTLLDQLRDDVVFAVYLSPKGEATVVVAAAVKDDAASRDAARSILNATKSAVTSFNTLGGSNKDAHFGVTLKTDSKLGAGKGDVLTLAPPKNLEKDAADAAPFLSKKLELDVVTVVSGNTAILAIGAGARDLAGSKPSASLASHAGLALARSASQGCHFCVALDPAGVARLFLAVDTELRADKTRARDIDTAAATVTRLGGAFGLGLKLEPRQGVFAAGLSKSLLVLSPADASQVSKLWGAIMPASEVREDKPLGGSRKDDKPLAK